MSYSEHALSIRSSQLLHTQALEKKDANPKDSQDVPQDDSPKASLRSPLRLHRIGTEVLCCAYTRNGDTFAVGASDGIVRVYSDDSKVMITAGLQRRGL